MPIEWPVQTVESRDDGRATLDALGCVAEEMSNVLPALLGRGAGAQSDSVGPRQKFLLALDRPIDHLTPDRLPFGIVRIKECVVGFTLKDESELPDEVIRSWMECYSPSRLRAGDGEPRHPPGTGDLSGSATPPYG